MLIKGKQLALFFKLRLDFEQFYQKEIVKVLKQINSKSTTVLKRRLIQYVKNNWHCVLPTIHHASLNCKLSHAVKFKVLF